MACRPSPQLALGAATLAVITACTGNPVQQAVDNAKTQVQTAVNQFRGLLKSKVAQTALKSYLVMAQNTKTKELVTAAVGDDGKFALDLEEGSSYVMNFLDSESNYCGTLAAGSGDSVVTGVKAGDSGDLLLGTNGQVEAADASKLQLDSDFKAAAADGVGIGFKLVGAASQAYQNLKNVLDSDGDGVPDILDADDDNNGVRDSVQWTGDMPNGAPPAKTVNVFKFFTNYPVDLTQATGDYVITFDIQPKPEYLDKFKSAVLLTGPSYAKKGRIGNRNTPTGATENLPGTWADNGLNLYQYTGDKRIEGFLSSGMGADLRTALKVGDVFRFLVTYTDGTTEILTNTIDTVFDQAPDNVLVNGNDAKILHTYATGPIISWDLVKDRDGNPIHGLTYQIEVSEQTNPGAPASQGFSVWLPTVDATSFDWGTVTDASQSFNATKRYAVGIKANAAGGNASRNGIIVVGSQAP